MTTPMNPTIQVMMTLMMETTNPQIILILLAAGSSTRMGTGKKKEYLPLNEGTVLSSSALAFIKSIKLNLICVTYPLGDEKAAKDAFYSDSQMSDLTSDLDIIFVPGGKTRQESVFIALRECNTQKSICPTNSIVLIHDAARPFVTEQIILDTTNMTLEQGAAVPALTPVDTQKELTKDGTIKRHLTRSLLGAVQTPQGFQFDKLLLCHTQAQQDNKEYTDDTEIWDNYPELTDGKPVHIVKGDPTNKKITFKQDIQENMINIPNIRTGFGTDLHRLVKNRKLILGGVVFDFDKGEDGHSDGDVLLHAITDALLGAAGLGDIGSYFPPEDSKWKNANSAELLKKCWDDVKNSGWQLGNLDAVIELEKPKFLPHRQEVIDSIANILEVDSSKVFVKAKTNESLGEVGNGLAVKAYCSCLIYK